MGKEFGSCGREGPLKLCTPYERDTYHRYGFRIAVATREVTNPLETDKYTAR